MHAGLPEILLVALLVGGSLWVLARRAVAAVRALSRPAPGGQACGGCSACGGCPAARGGD